MGYDPTDMILETLTNGSIETRFGSKTELEALITKAHTENMQVYADIVINITAAVSLRLIRLQAQAHGQIFQVLLQVNFKEATMTFTKTRTEIMMKGLSVAFRICVMPILMYKIGYGSVKIL